MPEVCLQTSVGGPGKVFHGHGYAPGCRCTRVYRGQPRPPERGGWQHLSPGRSRPRLGCYPPSTAYGVPASASSYEAYIEILKLDIAAGPKFSGHVPKGCWFELHEPWPWPAKS